MAHIDQPQATILLEHVQFFSIIIGLLCIYIVMATNIDGVCVT